MLVRETYPDEKVGALMSKHFVSIKINAEKGEGKALTEKYGVHGFPTMLLVDPKGEEVDRLVGYRPPDKFIADLKPILAGKSFAALRKRFKANPDDLETAIAYAGKLEERRKNEEAEAIYRRVADSKKAPAGLRLTARGRLAIAEFMRSRGQNAKALEEFFEKNRDSDAAVEPARILFSFYQSQQKNERAVAIGEYLLGKGQDANAEFLNNFAWFLAIHDLHLKRALELAKKAVKLSPEAPHILDTLAECYHRRGEHEQAVATQKKALKFVSEGQRPQYEKRLAQFEAALKKSRGSRD